MVLVLTFCIQFVRLTRRGVGLYGLTTLLSAPCQPKQPQAQLYLNLDLQSIKSKHGVNTTRRCTDIPFLLLFIVYWIGMFIVAQAAVGSGTIQDLVYVF